MTFLLKRRTVVESRRKWGSNVNELENASTGHEKGERSILPVKSNRKRSPTAKAERDALSRLGSRLAGADTLEAIASSIRDACDEMWTWDALLVSVRRSGGDDRFRTILTIDTIGGIKQEFPAFEYSANLYSRLSTLLKGRPVLVNRRRKPTEKEEGVFGDEDRISESLLYAPIVSEEQVLGIISIQSYTPRHYQNRDRDRLARIANVVAPAVQRCRADERNRAFLSLGQRLNAAGTPAQAAEVIVEMAADIIGWDACFVDLYRPEVDLLETVLIRDIVDGERNARVPGPYPMNAPGPLVRKALESGAQLLLRTQEELDWHIAHGKLSPFGDKERPSASLMVAPIRRGDSTVGVISIQSYSLNAYSQSDLQVLQALADHCGGALERTRAAESLIESEKRHRVLVESVNDGIVISQNDRFIFFNRRFADMLGYTTEELLKRDYTRIYTPKGLEILYARHARRLRGEEVPSRYETVFLRKDGQELEVEANITIMSDYGGSPATFAVVRDISERKRAEEQLFRTNALYETLVDSSEDYIFVMDREMRYVSVNRAVERRYRMRTSDRVGKTLYEVVDKRRADHYASFVQRAIDTKEAVRYDDQGVLFGKPIYTETVLSPIQGPDGSIESVVGVSRDMTERRLAEVALRDSEERYALAVQAANDGLWDWNLRNDTLYLSPRWWSIIGVSDPRSIATAVLSDWFDRVHPDDLTRLKEKISAHVSGGTPHLEDEHRVLHRDGSYRWVLSRGLSVRDDAGAAYRLAGSMSDVTVRKAAEEELQHGASHDALTGLPNRAYFVECLERAMARSRRRSDESQLFAILFLDLDRFKVINDSLGHLAGDELLVVTARRLEECVRPGDTVARLGGDEFTVLLEGIEGSGDATRVAERIATDLSQPVDVCGYQVHTTASIGIALDSQVYNSPDDLLRDADTAMYRAKAQGRSRYQMFDREMHARALAQLKMETDFRRAIESDEFSLHYQPLIELSSGRILGLEALVRWRHPDRGMIPPLDFIPLAEETSFIIPLGWWVLEEAAQQARVWNEGRDAASRISISVNLSVRQFSQPNLLERLATTLHAARTPWNALILEITESMLMDNSGSVKETLEGIRNLGIGLHVDDFGTGYSSLSYLHNFPLDMLKIDKSFVSDMETDFASREIIQAIITLGRGLKLGIVAEGVETKLQADRLKELGCDVGQGYYYYRPLDERAVNALLGERAAIGT